MSSAPDLNALTVVLLLLAVAWAGCLGDEATLHAGGPRFDPDAPVALTSLGEDAQSASRAAGATLLDAGSDVNVTFEGSFSAADMCHLATCDIDGRTQTHDLSGLVPFGLLVMIGVDATVDAQGILHGDPLEFSLRGTEVPERQGALIGGRETSFTSSLVRLTPGPITLEVHHSDVAAAPSVSYEVVVSVVADRTALPAGVPLALDLEEGSVVTLLPSASRPSEITLYDENDRRVARFEVPPEGARLRVPAGVPAGTYVLVAHQTPLLSLVADAEVAPRILPTLSLSSDRTPIMADPGGSAGAEGTFEVARPGLLYRLVVETHPGSVLGDGQMSGMMTLRITGPEGLVLEENVEAPFSCVLCPFPLRHAYASSPGAPHPVGLHTWQVTGDVGPNADVWVEVIMWEDGERK